MDAETAFARLDDWCKRRGVKLNAEMEAFIRGGGKVDDPHYRLQLGKSEAYLAMRSYLHGSVRAILKGE